MTDNSFNELTEDGKQLLANAILWAASADSISPVIAPRYGRINARANGVSSRLTDVPEFIVDPGSIKVFIDGVEAAAGSVIIEPKVDGRIAIDYSRLPEFFGSDSEHTITVQCADAAGATFDSGPREFTSPEYSIVDTANRVEDVDTSKGGFRVFAYQTAAGAPNRVFWSEEALRGEHGANLADMNAGPDLDRDGFGDTGGPSGVNGFIDPTVINYDATAGPGAGKFQDPDFVDPILSDAAVAGIISSLAGGDQDNSHHEITTYIEFPSRDIYTMGVTSDDGFKVSIAGSNRDVLGQVLGFRDRGGSASSVFHFLIDEPGIYPVRLLWFNGTGGSNVEWYSVRADGVNVLINDRATEGALSAYYEKSGGERARVTAASGLNALLAGGNVAPDLSFNITLEDGTTSVDESSVSFTFNGSSDGVTVNKSGSKTTVSFAPDGLLPANEEITIDFAWAEVGGVSSNVSLVATVLDYGTIESFRTDLGTGGIPGFSWRVHQQEAGRGNSTAAAEAQLAGGTENLADLSFADDGDIFYINTWINFEQGGGGQGHFQFGAGDPNENVAEDFLPGIPGFATNNTDNIAAEATTFVEFPEAKLYEMVVNSDDGFRVTLATDETTADGTIESLTSVDALELGVHSGGRGSADTSFLFTVNEPGVYPLRLIWYEGGGGANIEWFTVNSDGSRALINGQQPGALKAYRTRSGTPGNFVAPPVPDPDLTSPNDPIVASSDNSPGNGNENVDKAIDGDDQTKYLNFDAGVDNGSLPTGLTVTPGGSIITGISFTSANDAPERDPATYQLSGSTDGGATFTLIVEGDVPAFADRFTRVEVSFDNQIGYITYQLTFPTTVGPNQNSMQIAEIQLLGESADVAPTEPPAEDAGVAIADNGDGTVTITWAGNLQSSDKVEGPYADVAGSSPLSVDTGSGAHFYRAQ
ncbi:MAG TPA: discoidin domain-containing protein [Verrucomicrobiales bacterium]|nr:discoidin domain-containing protein [Verrucomicrobiales bacterium]